MPNDPVGLVDAVRGCVEALESIAICDEPGHCEMCPRWARRALDAFCAATPMADDEFVLIASALPGSTALDIARALDAALRPGGKT